MGAALALEDDVISAAELDGVGDLLDYFQKPHNFGLDNLPMELRNMILMMLELQGYTYGYMQHQVHTFGHTSLAMHGTLTEDEHKRRLQEEFWINFLRLLNELERHYEPIYNHVQVRIEAVRAEIVTQVMAIDATIAAAAATPAMAEAMKANHEERGILKWMKRRLEKHEAELAEANTAAEIVQVHQKMEQDLQDIKTGNVSPNRAASRPSPLTRISEYVRRRAEMFPDIAPEPETNVRGESEDKGSSSGGKGKGGRGGKSDDTSSGSGAGEKEEISPPPPPLIGD